MRKRKRGTLKSGRNGRRVKSRKQAIAIGLSEARRKGKKVPKQEVGDLMPIGIDGSRPFGDEYADGR